MKRRIAYAAWLVLALCLYFFENNTGSRMVLLSSFVLFVLAVEMILGREIIKNENNSGGASIVPVAFPLIAGP
ncbi:MAG: MarC family protein, partial [Clostridia bacterium]|nr:MarC family protein [Clostridia bacterium]